MPDILGFGWQWINGKMEGLGGTTTNCVWVDLASIVSLSIGLLYFILFSTNEILLDWWPFCEQFTLHSPLSACEILAQQSKVMWIIAPIEMGANPSQFCVLHYFTTSFIPIRNEEIILHVQYQLVSIKVVIILNIMRMESCREWFYQRFGVMST